ncbi:hypothetical protein [Paenibacillus sacheonensis]|uniref:IDEAL domain-containing protein n=1 Tax=Paenibacillus sacheonensis TaxID=742054 RepID=A0A7X5BYB1_9BACL|nr:hypothetical protein [Paenibacillus sacheonensis]MBM7565569.1 hypothetical protein [Paenibacillus sacheonensis]NBC69512.1 hypothetical protein [Paenibacillus sacheonensis]
MRYAISDWVQGRTRDGELVQGFITSFNDTQTAAGVYIVQSDHDAAVGTTAAVPSHWLRELPAFQVSDHEEAVRSLIELALATRDEEWFAELTGRLHAIEANQEESGDSAPALNIQNRLGRIHG